MKLQLLKLIVDMNDSSLYSLMQNEDREWLSGILESNCVTWLMDQSNNSVSKNRKAIIKARIQRINYLAYHE